MKSRSKTNSRNWGFGSKETSVMYLVGQTLCLQKLILQFSVIRIQTVVAGRHEEGEAQNE